MIDVSKLKIDNIPNLTASELNFWIELELGGLVAEGFDFLTSDRYSRYNRISYFLDTLPSDQTVPVDVQKEITEAMTSKYEDDEAFDFDGNQE